jgi:CheY-like chemotaxis protein
MKKIFTALVIDDQPTWLAIISELLQELDLEVVSTASYEEAVTLIEKTHIQLVVTDIRLIDHDADDVGGLKILSYISEKGLENQMAKIVLTGYGTRNWARQAFKEFKVDDFIPKQGPDGKGFDEEDFILSVQNAINKVSGNS